MSELHKFLFNGLPVRGVVVRLTDAWTEILSRRASNTTSGAYAPEVRDMLGEMTAAAALMQANIKFDGALVLQIFGDGPVKVAVVEVQSDLALRATATVQPQVEPGATLSQMVNANNLGRCAITLDPKTKFPGQQPYQGVVPLFGDAREKLEKFSDVLQHYMLQSEQLDTTLVLAANGSVAAGLLIQRLPVQGSANLEGSLVSVENEERIGLDEHYNRIAILAKSLQRDERHNSLELLSRGPVDERQFADWAMAFSSYAHFDKYDIPGFFPLDAQGLSSAAARYAQWGSQPLPAENDHAAPPEKSGSLTGEAQKLGPLVP